MKAREGNGWQQLSQDFLVVYCARMHLEPCQHRRYTYGDASLSSTFHRTCSWEHGGASPVATFQEHLDASSVISRPWQYPTGKIWKQRFLKWFYYSIFCLYFKQRFLLFLNFLFYVVDVKAQSKNIVAFIEGKRNITFHFTKTGKKQVEFVRGKTYRALPGSFGRHILIARSKIEGAQICGLMGARNRAAMKCQIVRKQEPSKF